MSEYAITRTGKPSVSAQVLIAFDKFKGSISAVEATSIFTAELLALDESLEIVQSPISDGGGGALEIIANYGYHLVEVSTVDALLRPRKAHYALSNDGDTAFIEMASICGIAELNQLNPFSASSFGLGEVARTAINSGAKNLIISLGGSASTDGGLGFLSGIGGKALDANGVQVSPNLYGLESVVEIHVDKVLKNIVWKFLIDVDNPLVGKNGAALVFGEQKGLNLEEALKANETLIRWADLLQHESGIDIRDLAGTGAAGGIVAPAIAFLDAEVTSGAEWFANLSHIERAVCEADFVVTGEGSFDQQSLMGKGPGLIIELARKHQKKIFVVAGRVDRKIADTQEVSAISLSEIATSVDDAISNPELWLRHAAHELLKILHV